MEWRKDPEQNRWSPSGFAGLGHEMRLDAKI